MTLLADPPASGDFEDVTREGAELRRPAVENDYNLAARVFGGDVSRRGQADARYMRTSDAASYNLAERVYGAGTRASHWPARPAAPLPAAGDLAGGASALAGSGPSAALTPEKSRRLSLKAIRGLRTFDSLHSAPFRWYFLSMLGVFGAMNMQMLVRGFLVYDLTGSYAALGTISLANAIPGLILSLPGGVIADRVPKKLVQQIGSTLNGVNTLSIAFLLTAGMLRWEHLLINAVIQGVVQSLMMPSRQSMLSDIVYPRLLMNAVALNNLGMSLSRMVMPALGGILLAVTDSFWVFYIMAGLYFFAVVALLPVPSKPIEVPLEERIQLDGRAGRPRMGGGHGMPAGGRRGGMGFRDLVDGMKYIVQDRTVGMILIMNIAVVMFSMPYMQMLPGFVQDVLDGGSGMQGFLMSATAIGSIAAGLVVASLPSRNRGTILLGGSLLLGVALTVFSFSNIFWLTAAVMIFIGVGQSVRMALSNVLVQSYTEPAYRGRVMSIYMMEMNLVQIGTFGVGLLAQAIGIQFALGLTSLTLVALSLGALLFIPKMRHLD
jgi:MFS family permease